MKMTPADEAALTFYFAARGGFERSTCGPMLENARLFGFGSDGRRIERYSPNWNWHPDGDEILDCHDDSGAEQGYTIDTDYIDRIAPVDRRLRLVEHQEPEHVQVLESYYGDSGNRWEENTRDRFDENGKPLRKGFGAGRICAVYQYTESGRKLILRHRMGGGEAHTPDEILERVYLDQQAQNKPAVTARLRKMGGEAEVLITAARISWLRTAAKPRPTVNFRRGPVLVYRADSEVHR